MQEQVKIKKIELGKELASLRKQAGVTNYRSKITTQTANQVIVSVEDATKAYTIDTLLKLLFEINKTIKIVDL